MAAAVRSRGWVFTINNPKDEEAVQAALADCAYAVYGREVGESGTPHLQGFAYWTSQRTRQAVSKKLGDAFIEALKGTPSQADAYCRKQDLLPWSCGVLPQAGKRNDLAAVRESLRAHGSMRRVAEEATSFQAIRGGEILLRYHEAKRNWKPEVRWYHGPTGSGKTRRAMDESNPNDRWVSGRDLKWWDGYDGHTDVILDDFRGDFCAFHTLLRILDRYEYRVEVKGGSRELLARRIWITSCLHPRDAYPGCSERVDQLIRRLDVVESIVSSTGSQVSQVSEVQGNNVSTPAYLPEPLGQ